MILHPEYTVDYICERMSLRAPQSDSLKILDSIMKIRGLDKNADREEILKQINAIYPICKEFERDFPSVTFALATGVGKTRLMGAFISYLYTNYGITNFMVIAPNLTIYNKLIEDMDQPDNPKYVFNGMHIFRIKKPRIITGENYLDQIPNQTGIDESICINIFNIGKINAEMRGNSGLRIKRLSECIGKSYFEFLSSRKDLVVLMDESHHYRADRGMTAINELNPLLGLELTATPQIQKSAKTIKFKNVVYEYSLAKAIVDGYVKEPAAATRRNGFDQRNYNDFEIDALKLRDGIRLHRATKAELQNYAINNGQGTVDSYKTRPQAKLSTVHSPLSTAIKPFVLVVCKDTTHAEEIKDYIVSDSFFNGYYADKVIEIHSNLRAKSSNGMTSEKDENITRLISLEDASNTIEIVIHVNMLGEGWDVKNLYTIVPLRAATSQTLIEQTIGRGLRLPYGKRTGNESIDRVTIVAHERFDKLIEEASKETSIIRAENIITVDGDDTDDELENVESNTFYQNYIKQQEEKLHHARSEQKKNEIEQEIAVTMSVSRVIDEVLSKPIENVSISIESVPAHKKAVNTVKIPLIASVPTAKQPMVTQPLATEDLRKPVVKDIIIKKVKDDLQQSGQMSMFDENDVEQKIQEALEPLIDQKIRSTIDIPDVALVQKNILDYGFIDFDLDTAYSFSSYQVPSERLHIETLQDNRITVFDDCLSDQADQSPDDIIVSELIDMPKIDYSGYAELWYKLAGQAIAKIRQYISEKDLPLTVTHYKNEIANEIYNQIMQTGHFYIKDPEFEVKIFKALTPINKHGYTKYRASEVQNYMSTVAGYELKHKIFGGYTKSCHTEYKYDSVPEHTLAIVLEKDDHVEKWLRPAPKQFKIWYEGGRLYEPDFIVETENKIYMVEVKNYYDLSNTDVILKAKAAKNYCLHVSEYNAAIGKKQWQYLMFADTGIKRSSEFMVLVNESIRNEQYKI